MFDERSTLPATCYLLPATSQSPKDFVMFTGLIREIATVKRYADNILTIQSSYSPKLGDSIAVNGVCLTVIKVNNDGFDLEVADETRRIVPAEKFQGEVHIEPAMKIDDRFEGHIVQGHVDTIGTVTQITPGTNATEFLIHVPPESIPHIIPKGSIAVDGISLTVNEVYEDAFRLTIIPHTLKHTLMHRYKQGTKVNIETDMFARYIDHIIRHRQNPKRTLSWQEIDAMSMSF